MFFFTVNSLSSGISQEIHSNGLFAVSLLSSLFAKTLPRPACHIPRPKYPRATPALSIPVLFKRKDTPQSLYTVCLDSLGLPGIVNE